MSSNFNFLKFFALLFVISYTEESKIWQIAASEPDNHSGKRFLKKAGRSASYSRLMAKFVVFATENSRKDGNN